MARHDNHYGSIGAAAHTRERRVDLDATEDVVVKIAVG
jgi:hypothetical protein